MGSNPIPSATTHMSRASVAAAALLVPSLAFIASAGLYALGLPSGPSGERLIADLNQVDGFGMLSPLLFLGGAFLALAVSVAAQVRLDLAVEGDTLHATARPQLQLALTLLAAISVLVLATLAAYVLAENWQCLVGDKLAC